MTFAADPALAMAIDAHKKRIMRDALVREMETGAGEHTTEIEGYELSIHIERA